MHTQIASKQIVSPRENKISSPPTSTKIQIHRREPGTSGRVSTAYKKLGQGQKIATPRELIRASPTLAYGLAARHGRIAICRAHQHKNGAIALTSPAI